MAPIERSRRLTVPRAFSDCAVDPEGFFRIGDLGVVDERGGRAIWWGGPRTLSFAVVRTSIRREVEDRLEAHPAVKEAVVVGVEDELLAEAVCASVVPVEGAIVTVEELRERCRRTLAEQRVPGVTRFFDALPTTGAGNVRRVAVARLIRRGRGDPARVAERLPSTRSSARG